MGPRRATVLAFLVEGYAPSLEADSLPALAQRIEVAAGANRAGGTVRHLQSSLIPGDEMCLCLMEGPSAEAVQTVAERAGLTVIRISEAVHIAGRARRQASPGTIAGH